LGKAGENEGSPAEEREKEDACKAGSNRTYSLSLLKKSRMKKRIAIPLENGLLSAHFGHSQAFAFVDVNDSQITGITTMNPPEHQPGTYPRWVAANGATDVIAGGMGPMAIGLFNEAGVNVFVGAPVDTPTNLVNNFLAGNLPLNANYCDHHDHHDHHGHHQGHDH